MEPKERIILALDVDGADAAKRMVDELAGSVGAFKVGLELVNAAGIGILQTLKSSGAERIFYDCKLHDIPNTVSGAMKAIASQEIWMTNVHACGGSRMVQAASDALRDRSGELGVPAPVLLAVTLLTSLSEVELNKELGVPRTSAEHVAAMAQLSQKSGAQGVVASPQEIEVVRKACGPDFLIVTPGVRPKGVASGDQRRVMTPREAVQRGADYLVVGRAITGASNPQEAASRILEEIA